MSKRREDVGAAMHGRYPLVVPEKSAHNELASHGTHAGIQGSLG